MAFNATQNAAFISTLQGNFKEIYAEKIEHVVPDMAKMQKRFSLSAEAAPGNYYNQPVLFDEESGVSYITADEGAKKIEEAIPAKMKNAQVRDVAILVRSVIATDVLKRASAGGKKAFKSAVDVTVKSNLKTGRKRVEVAIFYGGSLNGIGRVAKSATAITIEGTPATIVVLPIMAGHFASGIWSGAKGSLYDLYKKTDIDSNYASASAVASGAELVAIDFETKTLKFKCENATVATALQDALDTAEAGNSDIIIKYAGSKDCEFLGLDRILTHQSGDLFGINASASEMWRGISGNLSAGNLSLTGVLTKVSKISELVDFSKLLMVVSPRSWNAMTLDAILKVPTAPDVSQDTKKQTYGTKNLALVHNGVDVEIEANRVVKEGDIFLVIEEKLKRLGTEFEFNSGLDKSQYLVALENHDGAQLRSRTQQALFLMPCHGMKITNFTYGSGF